MSGLLLLEAGRARQQFDQQLVEADALGLGERSQVLVQSGAHSEVGLAAVGHRHDGTAYGTMSASRKRPRDVGASGVMAKELEVPMQAQVNRGDQHLYRGQAINVTAGRAGDGSEVRFTRKDLEVIEVYRDTGCVITEALDGQQFQMTIEEWERSAARKVIR